jgi:hypothetical protein
MVAALLAVVSAAPLAIHAARRELSKGRPAPLRAFARASGGLVLLQAALVGGAAARTALFTPCSLSHGIAFVPAVALPSALAAAALATLAAFLARGRPLRSALLYLAGVVASLGTTLLEGWIGPPSYLLDHLVGIWPGPIYDEALSLDRRLLLFRLGSLAWTAALLGVAQLVAVRRRTPPGRARGAAIATETRTTIEMKLAGHNETARAAPEVQRVIESAASRLGLATKHLPSGAGHDAQMMATLMPMGMIFVPSVAGISHSPKELTHWQDCTNGANVLLETVLELASK